MINPLEISKMRSISFEVLVSLVESAFQLKRYEKAITFAREGIDVCPDIARLHFILAFSIIKMHDLLNLKEPYLNGVDEKLKTK